MDELCSHGQCSGGEASAMELAQCFLCLKLISAMLTCLDLVVKARCIARFDMRADGSMDSDMGKERSCLSTAIGCKGSLIRAGHKA